MAKHPSEKRIPVNISLTIDERTALQNLAKQESDKEGRTISVSELVRRRCLVAAE